MQSEIPMCIYHALFHSIGSVTIVALGSSQYGAKYTKKYIKTHKQRKIDKAKTPINIEHYGF